MKLVDNFLNSNQYSHLMHNTVHKMDFEYKIIRNNDANLAGNEFWKKSESKLDDRYYLIHMFYNTHASNHQSNVFHLVEPLLQKIEVKKERIIRIQLNYYPKTLFKQKNSWHIDYAPNKNIKCKGMVYSLNTCNGTTDLVDSNTSKLFPHKVKSIENRAVFFDAFRLHRSTTCTNAPFRANIIFNWY